MDIQFVTLMIFTGPATEKNMDFPVRKVHDLYWACRGKNYRVPVRKVGYLY